MKKNFHLHGLETIQEKIYQQKKFEDRFSKLESKILAEKSNIENIIRTQHNHEVAVNDDYTIEINHHTNAPLSVMNSIQENESTEEIQQLQKITISDTPQDIKPPENLQTKPEDLNTIDTEPEDDLEEHTEEFKTGTYIIENIISNSTQITKEVFKIIGTPEIL